MPSPVLECSVRGLLGGKLQLVPHQLYIADRISNRDFPRALLADEVGLGKTIEAGLILHRLKVAQKIQTSLIIVPKSLLVQWYVEMRKKFNLNYSIVDESIDFTKENPFEDSSNILVGLEFLMTKPEAKEKLLEANFDMIVVDEAHRLDWDESGGNEEFKLLESMAWRLWH